MGRTNRLNRMNRLIVSAIVLCAVACNTGGSGGSGGDDENEDRGAQQGGANGVYEGDGGFFVNVVIEDTLLNNAPAVDDCVGDVSIEVEAGPDSDVDIDVSGAGVCNLTANVISWTVEADFVDDENFEGEIELVLNGQTHVLPIEGSLDGDEISAQFSGLTEIGTRFEVTWNGNFDARLLGSEEDDEEEGEEEEGAAAGGSVNGEYEGVGGFASNLILDDLNSNVEPTEADCIGDIDLVVDDGGEPQVVGEGQCLFPSNFMTYSLEGEVDGDSWSGVITLVFNNGAHEFDVEGDVNGNVITGEYFGVDIVVGSIRGIWDGEFSAQLVED